MPPDTCRGPGQKRGTLCGLPVASLGYCVAHYHQARRNGPANLTPIRAGDRQPVTIRVSPDAAARVAKDREGARAVLEKWAGGTR